MFVVMTWPLKMNWEETVNTQDQQDYIKLPKDQMLEDIMKYCIQDMAKRYELN